MGNLGSGGDGGENGAERLLRRLAALMLVLLGAQFLLGMVVNLFVTVPSAHPGAGASNYFRGVALGTAWALADGAAPLVAHVATGLLLLLASLVMVALAARVGRRGWVWATVLGWIGVTGAAFNGVSFVNYGHDVSSLLMSVAFLLAVSAYAAGLYTSWERGLRCAVAGGAGGVGQVRAMDADR